MKFDDQAVESVKVAFFFGGLGLATGMLWANATWGTFWTSDPKLNNTAIGLLIYSAYFVLRGSLDSETQRGRLSAVYNIFSYAVFIPLIYVLPRMMDSLHPGSGDNPTFRLFDTAHNMKLVVYTAIISFMALGWWFLTIFLRLRSLKKLQDEKL
jgi:heme exporter protein C